MLPSEIVYFSSRGLEAQAKPHKINPSAEHVSFIKTLHTGLKSHRSQCCGVKLIDTHCKIVALMVSYD